MIKLTKRKGFNFFRSYYDVYNELNNKDKLAFMDALLDRQFLGVKPKNLKGMALFAYISQTNSIDGQVKGYEHQTGVTLTPCETPCQGATVGPSLQVKGKVKEKGKEQGGLVFPYEIQEEWNQWKTFKKEEFNFRYKSLISEQAALKKLGALAKSKEEAQKIIMQSIESGWKGLFELKSNGRQKRLSTEQEQYLAGRKDI